MPLPPVATLADEPFVLVSWDWITMPFNTGNPEHHSGLLKPIEAGLGTVERAHMCAITLETEYRPINLAVWGYDLLGPEGGAADIHSPVAGFGFVDGGAESPFDVSVDESQTLITFSDMACPRDLRLLVFQAGWQLEEAIDDAPLIGASWASYVR